MSAIVTEAASADPWTSRARPGFLYVIYTLILWSIPMGIIAAVQPQMAHDIATGMSRYLNGLPEPLYALFGTGYLGYTAARQWGKAKGTDKLEPLVNGSRSCRRCAGEACGRRAGLGDRNPDLDAAAAPAVPSSPSSACWQPR